MSRNANKFGNTADKAFDKASKSATSFKSITKGILAASAVQQGLGLIKQGVGGAIGEFVRFDDAITGAAARFKDLDPATRGFKQQFFEIKQAARAAGATTEFSASQAADALDFLARAGFSSAEAMGSLNSMINLATATGEDFAQVADYSSDLLGAFGLAANTTAEKIANLNRLNDVLVKTTNSANVTVESMFETMKQVGPVATGVLGASLEEVSALTGVLGNSGIKGSEAMTALKNAYLRLAAPVGAGAELLKELNITLDDGQGGAKKMTDLMAEMGEKIKGFGKIKQAEILDTVFGKRAIAGGKNIIDNIANIKEFEKTLLGAAGTSRKTAEFMRQSLGNRLKSLQSALIETGFKFLSAFDKDGKGAIDRLTEAIRGFDVQPIIDGAKNLIKYFSIAYKTIKPFLPLIKELAIAWLAYTAVMKAFFAAGLIVNFIKFLGIIRQAIVAQGLLNAVMTANPMGLIITAIGALVAVVVLLYRNWDKVEAGFIYGVTAIGAGIRKLYNWFQKMLDNPFFSAAATLFAPFITIPALIIKHWEPIKKLFGGIGDKFSKISSGVKGFFGIGDDETAAKAPPVVAPNQAEVDARQAANGTINMNIAGAPEGTTIENKTTGAPAVNVALMGANI